MFNSMTAHYYVSLKFHVEVVVDDEQLTVNYSQVDYLEDSNHVLCVFSEFTMITCIVHEVLTFQNSDHDCDRKFLKTTC